MQKKDGEVTRKRVYILKPFLSKVIMLKNFTLYIKDSKAINNLNCMRRPTEIKKTKNCSKHIKTSGKAVPLLDGLYFS